MNKNRRNINHRKIKNRRKCQIGRKIKPRGRKLKLAAEILNSEADELRIAAEKINLTNEKSDAAEKSLNKQ